VNQPGLPAIAPKPPRSVRYRKCVLRDQLALAAQELILHKQWARAFLDCLNDEKDRNRELSAELDRLRQPWWRRLPNLWSRP
jgi:hypothetical protein